ncbi:ATP-binding protein [Chryseobacterium profundimaris]|uniref:ORC1/DEAH AAA+ ATPase domain-containing protein n=1 Tax=Chryseobacterium profundimaris TaxID=1387275 RepID=A0ABY1NH29_9FLAO|nr:ATP-binding protein [Chryseobacterium profundimaris]SMP08928.1 hypothetical protein SAMN06264346_1028 [Chryseobacterium profundimaris]
MITAEYRKNVANELINRRPNFGGTNSQYGKIYGITGAMYSRISKGETEKIISDGHWMQMGRELGITRKKTQWNVVRTKVYTEIESSIIFCQNYSTSIILVDDCGIGKTFSSRNIVKTLKNGFHVDCSQAKTKQQFIRLLAKTIGVDNKGKYVDVKENLKYYLNNIDLPVIVLDEIGDLEYTAFLELKELWNATEGCCGWYMIGADGLRAKIVRGINSQKVGFAEIFRRFSEEFVKLVPTGTNERRAFKHELLMQVGKANYSGDNLNELVKMCIDKDKSLSALETLIKLSVTE